MSDERIIAVGLLTGRDVERLGKSFQRLWPVDETPCLSGLLQSIEADRQLHRDREADNRQMLPPIRA